MEKTFVQAVEDLKKGIVDVKDALKAKVDETAERAEAMDKAVFDIQTRLENMETAYQRKSSLPEEIETPQASHIIKNYGKVSFSRLLNETKAYKGDGMLRGLQERADYAYMLGVYKYYDALKSHMAGNRLSLKEAIMSTNYYKQFDEDTQALRKALSTGASASGTEFVPTGFSADLIDRVRLGLRVAALHRRLTLPRNPFDMPARIATLPMGFKVSERTSDNLLTEANRLPAVSLGTRKVSFSAVGLGGLVVFSTEQDEDSIVPMLPFARDELVEAIQNAQETATLNGKGSGTHPDNDIETDANKATRAETAWDGYRQVAIDPSTDTKADLSTFNETNLRALRGLMGKYGSRPGDLAWVTSIKVVLNKMLNLNEVTTLDKYGPSAVVLNGELASFDGVPIVVSEYSRDDVHTTGFNTSGESNNKSVIVCVHRPSFVYGDVRQLQVIEMPWPLTDQIVVIAKLRSDFQSLHVTSTETIVALGHNV